MGSWAEETLISIALICYVATLPAQLAALFVLVHPLAGIAYAVTVCAILIYHGKKAVERRLRQLSKSSKANPRAIEECINASIEAEKQKAKALG